MGYDLHITRRADWADEEGPAITQAEWESYITTDPDLRLDGYMEATTAAGATLRMEEAGIAVWIAHPHLTEHGGWITLDSRGNIVVKNPDEAFRQKMWKIAQALDARLVGDEGETYGPDGEEDGGSALPPAANPSDDQLESQSYSRRSLWQRIRGR